ASCSPKSVAIRASARPPASRGNSCSAVKPSWARMPTKKSSRANFRATEGEERVLRDDLGSLLKAARNHPGTGPLLTRGFSVPEAAANLGIQIGRATLG